MHSRCPILQRQHVGLTSSPARSDQYLADPRDSLGNIHLTFQVTLSACQAV
jgi:hypothetical protein